MLLQIKNLHFAHDPEKALFRNFNLTIPNGKIIALAGESGCGKSTLLSLIYGLLDWQQGEIILDGVSLYGPKGNIVPGEHEMKFVAQHYDLMPYATVSENVGKFLSNINLNQKHQRIAELLEVVGLTKYADALPKNLSGGEQQRVAIARALSVLPKLLLLDEPFSNLDFSRKIQLRERLFNYAKKENISLLISTHEIQEVMPWLDQIVVLKNGRLIQNDSPIETYTNPYNDYVARLFGEVNIFSEQEQQELNLHKRYYYPDEILLKSEGHLARVVDSRFSGSYYWNKIHFKNKELIIYTDHQLSGEVQITFNQ